MIKLGLLSDSHGRAQTTREAVDLLLDQGADMLIHLGDIGTVQVIDALAATNPKTGQQIESHMVFGNTDYEAKSLGDYARDLGIHVHEPYGRMTVDGCEIAFTHGHVNTLMDQFVDQGVDYLLHGHTHIQSDGRVGQTRVINPGALFRASRHTAAVLCPASGDLEVVEVVSVAR